MSVVAAVCSAAICVNMKSTSCYLLLAAADLASGSSCTDSACSAELAKRLALNGSRARCPSFFLAHLPADSYLLAGLPA